MEKRSRWEKKKIVSLLSIWIRREFRFSKRTNKVSTKRTKVFLSMYNDKVFLHNLLYPNLYTIFVDKKLNETVVFFHKNKRRKTKFFLGLRNARKLRKTLKNSFLNPKSKWKRQTSFYLCVTQEKLEKLLFRFFVQSLCRKILKKILKLTRSFHSSTPRKGRMTLNEKKNIEKHLLSSFVTNISTVVQWRFCRHQTALRTE